MILRKKAIFGSSPERPKAFACRPHGPSASSSPSSTPLSRSSFASGSLRLPFNFLRQNTSNSTWSPLFGLAHYFPCQDRSSTSQRSSAFRHRSSPTHASGIFLALVSFLISTPFRAVRGRSPRRPRVAAIIAIHDVIRILSIIPSYLYAGATPPASSPDTCALSVPTWQYYYSCAFSLPFRPTLCSCPPLHNCALPPRTPPRAHAPQPATCHRTCTDGSRHDTLNERMRRRQRMTNTQRRNCGTCTLHLGAGYIPPGPWTVAPEERTFLVKERGSKFAERTTRSSVATAHAYACTQPRSLQRKLLEHRLQPTPTRTANRVGPPCRAKPYVTSTAAYCNSALA